MTSVRRKSRHRRGRSSGQGRRKSVRRKSVRRGSGQGRKKGCLRSQIRNPSSGRCVLRSGKIGKRILSGRKTPRGRGRRSPVGRNPVGRNPVGRKSPQGCDYLYVASPYGLTPCDPQTVDRTYFMYDKQPESIQQFMQDDKEKLLSIYCTIVKRYSTNIFKVLPSNVEFVKQYGAGAFGEVYQVAHWLEKYEEPDMVALKIQKMDPLEYDSEGAFTNQMTSEYTIQNEFAQQGYAPHADHLYFFRDARGVLCSIIWMERLKLDDPDEHEYIIGTLLKEPLTSDQLDIICHMIWTFMSILCDLEVVHGDLHWDNLLIDLAPRGEWDYQYAHPMLIDFGKSRKGKCNRKVELLGLLKNTLSEKYHVNNRNSIRGCILNYLEHYEHLTGLNTCMDILNAYNEATYNEATQRRT
jgi:hypothetical protein